MCLASIVQTGDQAPLLPVSMDISGVDLSAIRAPVMSAEVGVFPPEREQSFGGGGGGICLV